jgi:phage tail sheath protein FI
VTVRPTVANKAPGVYVLEAPRGGPRAILGVSTSTTAFVGRAFKGPLNEPVRIQSFAEFERSFGALWEESTMSYAVLQYFLNGGTDAIIVRVHNPSGASVADDKATIVLPAGSQAAGPQNLTLEAASPGSWGRDLRVSVNHDVNREDPQHADLFNLIIEETRRLAPGTEPLTVQSETFTNVSRNQNHPRFVTQVLAQESALVRVRGAVPPARPDRTVDTQENNVPIPATGGSDGQAIQDAQVSRRDLLETPKEGMFALLRTDELFNLLCIPPFTRQGDVGPLTRPEALRLCKDRDAMFIVDPPVGWRSVQNVITGVDNLLTRDPNAALYFPRVRMVDPLRDNRLEEFAPCGVVAGVMARTDAQRGVFKAPAGQETPLFGVSELAVRLTDGDQGRLNSLGVNCLRTFPVMGHVVWGARTLRGADRLASEWKYVPVRRLALFIKRSLYEGTQWAVFEPNDADLWAALRLSGEGFMQNLFRQGAFQGASPREAYFVDVSERTTTPDDINNGIVNLLVRFRPVGVAEFLFIIIQQMAGQAQTV